MLAKPVNLGSKAPVDPGIGYVMAMFCSKFDINVYILATIIMASIL